MVDDLEGLIELLGTHGVSVESDEPVEGFTRVYVADPFNRIDLLEPHVGDEPSAIDL